ncbi:MAG: NEAT domain-containing protein [Eubacterium sp.]|nr:NEAT domain-containing protein [Eubacterium sp.]
MELHKIFKRGMTAVLTASMLAPTAVGTLGTVAAEEKAAGGETAVADATAAAAAHDDGSPSGAYNPEYENVPETAKRPTQSIDFSQYAPDYYYTVLEVPVYLYNSEYDDTYSMGNGALTHTAYIMVDNKGEATVKLQFHGMDYMGQYGHLQRMTYFNTTQEMYDWQAKKPGYESLPQQVEVERKSGNNYEQVSFKLSSGDALVGISPYVDMMGTVVTALVGFDYSQVKVLNGEVNNMNGTEVTEWLLEQFDNNVNWQRYSDKYADVFDKEVMDARNYLDYGVVPDNGSLEWINKLLFSDYMSRQYYLRKDALVKALTNYQSYEQGDYTDESWSALTDCIGYLDFINSADCSDADVVEIENEWNAALAGLTRKDGAESYRDQLMKVVEECEAMTNDDGKYLSGSWSAFQRKVASGRTIAETGSDVQCRSRLEEAATWKDILTEKRVVVEDGIYEVSVTPKVKDENGNLTDTTALDGLVDFSKKMKVEVYNGKATLTISAIDKDGFPYLQCVSGNGQSVGDSDSYWVSGSNTKDVTLADGSSKNVYLDITLKLPSQADAANTSFGYWIMNEQGKSVDDSYNHPIYLDVDYANATKTGDIQADKSALQELLENCRTAGRDDYNGMLAVYTEETAQAMVDAYNAAVKVNRNTKATQYDIDAAIAAIYAADDALESYSDIFKDVAQEVGQALNNPFVLEKHSDDAVAALKAAYDDTFGLVMSGSATNAQIKEATEKLQAAYDTFNGNGGGETEQADKTALNAEIAKAEANIAKNIYTPGTVSKLNKALTAAKAVAEKADATQAEVDAQTKALQAANNGLIDGGAMTMYLENAKAITDSSKYTEDSWKTLQDAIAAAEAALNDENLTQDAYYTASDNLQAAIDGLVENTETGVLKDGVYAIPVSLMHASMVGQESMGNNAIKDHSGTLTVKDGKATLRLEMVPLPIANLNGYLLAMEVADPDNMVMTQTNILDWQKSGFLETNYVEYYDVVDDFNKPDGAADPNAAGKMYPKTLELSVTLGQEETWVHVYVPAMGTLAAGDQVARLTLDYDNATLVEAPVDKTALAAKVEEAKGLVSQTDKYTEDSLKALQAAIDAAQEVVDQADAEQAAVDAQMTALQAAIDGLTEITQPEAADKTALSGKLEEAKGLVSQTDKYTEDSLKALQAAIDAAQAVADKEDAAQADVDAQAEALDAAIKALVEKDNGGDNTGGNDNTGDNTGDNNGGSADKNTAGSAQNNTNAGSTGSAAKTNVGTGITSDQSVIASVAALTLAAGALTGGMAIRRKRAAKK